MHKIQWLMTALFSPVAVVAFCFAICAALALMLVAELHQQFWHSESTPR